MNDTMSVVQKLASLASISGGYSFRGAVPEVAGGPLRVVQMKDVCTDGTLSWETTLRAEMPKSRRPLNLLQQDDVLVLSRGLRYSATHVNSIPGPALCTLHFFLIRANKGSPLAMDFLAWQINQDPAQRYLIQNAEGSAQRSIRRSVLEDLLIVLPPIEIQRLVVELDRQAKAERDKLQTLIDNRTKQLKLLAKELLK
ncbi:MAG: restriction endonuclease subunit S [Proteobacteria bacterium]|nr:restriction endonuclease subunit S [Desulfobulbaceae bacterium]MBU4152403.1 restriction endonuclease subunit S [Pseudomonadota bacterium]